MKLFLRKNDKNIEVNRTQGDERLPYFSLFIVPEEQGKEWFELGAFWKSKSGKGYSGKFNDKKAKVEITRLEGSTPVND